MNQIYDMPEELDSGLDFNYENWTPNTEVMLCNVPWDSDYRLVNYFNSHDSLDAYIRRRPHKTISLMTRAKLNRPIRLSVPFGEACKYNYIAVTNGRNPFNSKRQRFYYFINDVQDIAPSTTEFVLQLDAWQTFYPEVKIGNAYIERGHVGIANWYNFNGWGKDFLTVSEGLDIGHEYNIVKEFYHVVGDTGEKAQHGISFVIFSTIALNNKYGSMESPKMQTADGFDCNGVYCALDAYLVRDEGSFKALMQYLSDFPWIARGIISAMAVPTIRDEDTDDEPTRIGKTDKFIYKVNRWVPMEGGAVSINLAKDFRDYFTLPEKYAHLNKFKTYPYAVVEATSYSGNPLILKPECLPYTGLYFLELYSPLSPNPRIVWTPQGYNSATGDSNIDKRMSGEFLDMQTGIMNFPQWPIVNDGYMSYMAQNSNSIAYQYSSADWSNTRTNAGITLGYNQATQAMNTATQLTNLGISTNNANRNLALSTNSASTELSQINNVAGGAMGVIGNALGGNVGGAISSALNTGLNMYTTDKQSSINANSITTGAAISNNQMRQSNNINNANAAYVRDSNRDYAQFAQKGDYANAIAGIQAKTNDAKLIQPTTSGQLGGDAFTLVSYFWGLRCKLKLPQNQYIRAIGDYWLRYGYAIGRFVDKVPRDLKVMEKFSYWQFKECNVSSSTCPELYKQTIRGILEKGVTVYSNPDDIGVSSIYDNKPIYGVYYE